MIARRTQRRSDNVTREIHRTPLWVAEIFSSRFVATRSQWGNHSFLVAPRGYEKISRNAARTYFEMGAT